MVLDLYVTPVLHNQVTTVKKGKRCSAWKKIMNKLK